VLKFSWALYASRVRPGLNALLLSLRLRLDLDLHSPARLEYSIQLWEKRKQGPTT
jgi:hypothetical protein